MGALISDEEGLVGGIKAYDMIYQSEGRLGGRQDADKDDEDVRGCARNPTP